VGWALAVFQVTATDPMLSPLPATARTWSLGGLGLVGAVCGATGAALTGAALVAMSRRTGSAQGRDAGTTKDRRLARIAGAISGLVAAALCTYLGALVLTQLLEGSLESLDLVIFAMTAIYATPVCIPTIALVSVPLGIGCAYAGQDLAQVRGKQNPKGWIWLGAAIGGVLGYLLGMLIAATIGYM
jgi:hypothetical protein